ncbi:MAG: TIGR03013 family PEP-CTERM/XrtA system glycosyltransferase [Gammaproteobacteria bacterium]|nr:TIGR03013 family PEP-CTERM/XrtA system glycosyltransferase [Gammaproteobacteria bacterium]
MPKYFVFLGLVEAALFFVSIYLGVALRFWGEEELPPGIEPIFFKATLFMLLMVSINTAMGLYQRQLREGFSGMLLRLGAGFLLGFALMSLIFYAFPSMFLGRGAFGIALFFAFICVVAARAIFFKLVDQDALQRRVLVLGAGARAKSINERLRRKLDRRGFVVVGYVSMGGEELVERSNIIHADTTLLEISKRYDAHEIVEALDDRRKAFPVHEILDCRMSGIEVIDLLTFFERQRGKVMLDIMHPSWMVFSDGFRFGAFRVYSKRVIDIVAALLLLAVTWPIMLLTALAILFEDSGPIFYRQVRVGQNWKLFQVIKFRSMRVDAEAQDGAQWALENDNRITRVGDFIRKVRIDELPQIFNVLKGEMSFVGPRPERPEFVEQLSASIPYYAERHRVKPGITGWAQICYPYGASEQDSYEKLQYDLYYVKNYSLLLDLMIVFQTSPVIFWRQGSR